MMLLQFAEPCRHCEFRHFFSAADISVVAVHSFFPACKEFYQLDVLSSFDTSLSSFRVPRSSAKLEQVMFPVFVAIPRLSVWEYWCNLHRFGNLPQFFTPFRYPDNNIEFVISSNCCCNFVSFPHICTMSPSTILLKRFWWLVAIFYLRPDDQFLVSCLILRLSLDTSMFRSGIDGTMYHKTNSFVICFDTAKQNKESM